MNKLVDIWTIKQAVYVKKKKQEKCESKTKKISQNWEF